MLYVCIPTHNEAVTIGVLLWRLRETLREQVDGRDYEIVVYDDASTDATADVLAPYDRVLPLTSLRGDERVGQTAAVDALVRYAVTRSRAPEVDGVVLMQADFTDAPGLLPSLLVPFDAGADVVLTNRVLGPDQPVGERRLRRAASLLLPPLVRAAARDATGRDAAGRDPGALLNVLRLIRVSVLRDALAAADGAALVSAPGWAGTAELAIRTAPFARTIERVDAPAQYGVRTRASRIDWPAELRALAAVLWRARRPARRVQPHGVGARASVVGGVPGNGAAPNAAAPNTAAPNAAAPTASTRDAVSSATTLAVPPEPATHADRPRRARDRARPRPDRPATQRPASVTAEPATAEPAAAEPASAAPYPPAPRTPAPSPPTAQAPAVEDPDGSHDDADTTAAPKNARRRRRGRRGRAGVADAGAADVGAADGNDPEAAATGDDAPDPVVSEPARERTRAPASEPSRAPAIDAMEPTDAPPDHAAGEPSGAPARRRRRRGSRRRATGSEGESGVRPDDTGADPAMWHDAPSDQPSS